MRGKAPQQCTNRYTVIHSRDRTLEIGHDIVSHRSKMFPKQRLQVLDSRYAIQRNFNDTCNNRKHSVLKRNAAVPNVLQDHSLNGPLYLFPLCVWTKTQWRLKRGH